LLAESIIFAFALNLIAPSKCPVNTRILPTVGVLDSLAGNASYLITGFRRGRERRYPMPAPEHVEFERGGKE